MAALEETNASAIVGGLAAAVITGASNKPSLIARMPGRETGAADRKAPALTVKGVPDRSIGGEPLMTLSTDGYERSRLVDTILFRALFDAQQLEPTASRYARLLIQRG
jgi:hypothetical protein